MFLKQVRFGPIPLGLDLEAIYDRLDEYLVLLQRNGQICGDPVRSVFGGYAVAYVYAVRPDSTQLRFHSSYGIDELNVLRSLFGCDPSWQLMADDVPGTFAELHEDSELCLVSSDYDGASPICFMSTGDRFPTYLVSIDDDERERLFFWSREYSRLQGIWLSSGELEASAYEQLASPTSLLARQGRQLAETVENALERPVFYFLMRHYGRGDHERDRRCPSCGGEWYRDLSRSEASNFWIFPFRCDDCRLVSHFANADYDDSYAHIGEYQEE
ncbi:MAG: hypothetical protein DWQ31_08335 [Planctomycetota bacterium]|nr:MAG: hypothetical protein DWQ31_08335 [Planctomycetota bacterium]REJ90920.1 MAG: hypothetical protein DWQ35_15665 [Planctomycetota bacterium]REK17697.1 MAG: hypothetical protein DWQ42_21880 [Planctomycetota bacterium]REK46750.1 MAG: hypothetical protein DWQ46_05990 [Planctomycetota bacterium]